ncbi:SDR family NAD(P)-dependent oxidoreductase [Sinimarinibacterium sp. CAU 1509]|uniref:SDR family NAD(P)-dependent oxidoreductase n=1 Tax=Sinimarinibacterium sp. CAU 1509 TaxID=2562283 RepID=UPI0010ACC308|nr:SDR family NAD(P)-dependent oxidoreductase [Sinimarinibacterium sp. CAU 1509]TJY58273.1 SDR family NAD(P)-dependent oxidoreductase [Sinimarinibacterium sp. CAU 1509]
MYSLKNKVAVITGAGSGIGRALAVELADKGCRLALSDVNAAGLAATAELLPVKPFTQILDVSDRDAVYAHADAVKREFGTAHVVINNAGVALSQTIEDLSYEDFEWLMGINFWGVVYGTKAFLPMLRAQNDGVIVNLSSIFGIVTLPTQGAYHAAKFAVRGFTETLRQELAGTGVSAVCVHPGGIKTNIARAARFYVSATGDSDRDKAARDFDKLARTTPEQAARTIIEGIEKRSPRVLIGADARLLDRLQRWLPVAYPKVLAKVVSLSRR